MPTRENYLAHHGVKGQKWGVRRYQNLDGSLTELGRKHYGYGKEAYNYYRNKTAIGKGYGRVHANEKYIIDSAKRALTKKDPDDQRTFKQRTLLDPYFNKDKTLTEAGKERYGYDKNGEYKAWRERGSSIVNEITGGKYLSDKAKKGWWKAQNFYLSNSNPYSFKNVDENDPKWMKTVIKDAVVAGIIQSAAATLLTVAIGTAFDPVAKTFAKTAIKKVRNRILIAAGVSAGSKIINEARKELAYEPSLPGNYSSESQRVAQEQLNAISKFAKPDDLGKLSEIVNNYAKSLDSSEAKSLKEEFVRQNWNNMRADPIALNNMRTTITNMDDYGWDAYSKAAGTVASTAKVKQSAKDAAYKATLMGTVATNLATRNRPYNEIANELQKSYNAKNQPAVKEYKAKGEELINKYLKENEDLKERVDKLEKEKEKDKKK